MQDMFFSEAQAKKFLNTSIKKVENWNDFLKNTKNKKMIFAPFCEEPKCEDWIKDKTGGVSSRVIPFKQPSTKGKKCVHCHKPATAWAYFARAY